MREGMSMRFFSQAFRARNRTHTRRRLVRRCVLERMEDRLVPAGLSSPYVLPGDTLAAPAAGKQEQAELAQGNNGFLAVWGDYRSSLAGVPSVGSLYFGTGLGSLT